MSILQNKKKLYILAVIVLFLLLFAGRTRRFEASSRYYTSAQMSRKYGTYYWIASITKLKVSKGKVAITGELRDRNDRLLKKKKRTFKLAKKMKEYYIEGDLPWHFEGNRSRSTFIRWLKSRKKINFPSVHIWVRKGKITAFALSA